MSWLISIVAAVLAAIVCGAGTLGLSSLAVRWYRVSNFEGAAGYAVVGLTIIGAAASGLIALIAARVAVGQGHADFGGQMLWAMGASWGVLAIAWLATWMRADIPPKLDGLELDLVIELRFPADQTGPPRDTGGKATFELGALNWRGRVVRARRTGEVCFDRASQVNGRWIVPARAHVFTSRGRRIILLGWSDQSQGFVVPMRRPARRHREWSDWLPYARRDGVVPAKGLTYRYRVEPAA